MSKRIIAMVIAVVLAAALVTGCGQSKIVIPEVNTSSAVDNGSVTGSGTNDNNVTSSAAPASSAEAIDTNKVAQGIKVEGVPFSTEYSNKLFLFLTNESGSDCNVTINVDFFGADGNIVGTTSGYIDAFQNGTTVAESFYCDDPFEKYEYSVSASDLSYYIPVDKDLSVEVSKATNKAIVSVTNNGTQIAKYPQYYAFFYKDGKLVYDNWGYCDDADSELKPGATERDEASCYEDFDDVKVFVHSYAYED